MAVPVRPFLVAPPRRVPLLLAIEVLLGGLLIQWGFVFFGVGGAMTLPLVTLVDLKAGDNGRRALRRAGLVEGLDDLTGGTSWPTLTDSPRWLLRRVASPCCWPSRCFDRRPVYAVTIAYADSRGGEHRAVVKTHLVERLHDPESFSVLFAPWRPALAVPFSLLPKGTEVDARGQLAGGSVLRVLVAAIAPTLVALVVLYLYG